MKWRIIDYEVHGAAKNMAIDEAIAESVAKNESPPTIRFYGWKPSSVSIGFFQSLHAEIDVKECDKRGIDIVRRRTGGGAVFHDKEITYSVIAPLDMFPKDIIASYREICSWIISGLKTVGIDAEFIPINDIITNGKKISGNAQTRKNGVLQQHGTILYEVDVDTMFQLLKVPNEKIRDKMIATVKERVTSAKIQCNCTQNDLYAALEEAFAENKEIEHDFLTPQEQVRSDQLVVEKYASDEWTNQR